MPLLQLALPEVLRQLVVPHLVKVVLLPPEVLRPLVVPRVVLLPLEVPPLLEVLKLPLEELRLVLPLVEQRPEERVSDSNLLYSSSQTNIKTAGKPKQRFARRQFIA